MMTAMKTITITIPEELDDEAATEAKRQGISKSELIRRGLAAVLPDHDARPIDDPWHQLAGFAGEGLEPGEIDRVVYGS
jgi:Arc/MetJ-type ribon-helix-helix transcriptional regulator